MNLIPQSIRNLFGSRPALNVAPPTPAETRSYAIPSTPVSASNIDGSGANILYTTVSDSGVQVNEWTGLSATPVYAAISLIADTIGYLDLPVYQRQLTGGKRGKNRMDDHPVSQLLQRPNDAMTGDVLRNVIQCHALSWGNGYCYIEYSPSYQPVSLVPLLPDRTYPYRKNDGTLIYRTRVGTTIFDLRPDEVMHIRSFTFNGLNGLGPIALFRQTIGKQLAFDKFGAKLFSNGLNVSGVISHPGNLSEPAQLRLRNQVNARYTGIDNAHKVMLLEEGMQFVKTTIPPDEAQWLESMKFGVADIARIFRVPPHMIGDLEKATNNNIEEQGLNFLSYCLTPWLTRWEAEINRKLFTIEDQRAGYHVRFDPSNLLRANMTETAEYYKQMSNVLTVNEIREALDKNPLTYGDVIMVQSQNIPLEKAIAGEPPPPSSPTAPTDEDRIAKRAALDQQYRSTFNYAITAKPDADSLRQLVTPYVQAVRGMAVDECRGTLPSTDNFDSWVRQYCATLQQRLRQDVPDATADERCNYEMRRLRSAVTRETYAASGVKNIRWAGANLNGSSVQINQPFIAGESRKVFHPPMDLKCNGEIFPDS